MYSIVMARFDCFVTSFIAFAHVSGLREAVSWLVLYQDLQFSFMRQKQLSIDFNGQYWSVALAKDPPKELANRVLLLFARVLNLAFAPADYFANRANKRSQWQRLTELAESWYHDQPAHAALFWVIKADREPSKISDSYGEALSFTELLKGHQAHVAVRSTTISRDWFSRSGIPAFLGWDYTRDRSGMHAIRKCSATCGWSLG